VLPAAFIKDYDQRRLRLLLGALFLALAIPTGAVIWQAWDQLKWESWYQYRNQAETLTNRLDLTISDRVAVAEARNFTDFSFLAATANASVQQRSPLSTYPVPQDLPGVIGYFQVDPDGSFSTPLLPPDGTSPESVGLATEEYLQRSLLADNIRQVLADNQLVRDRGLTGNKLRQQPASIVAPDITEANNEPEPATGFDASASSVEELGALSADAELAVEEMETEQAIRFEQQAFDDLSRSYSLEAPAATATLDDRDDGQAVPSRAGRYGKVQDIPLDEALQRKNEDLKRSIDEVEEERKDAFEEDATRARRVEKSVLPAAAPAELPGKEEIAITTFESEVDPYQFSLLDSEHLVLFRNVWRDGSRYIQGLLIDQSIFSGDVIESAFYATSLSDMSDLILGYQDDIIDVFRGNAYDLGSIETSGLGGSLLYRSSLTAPFDSVELIFTINRMPPGPGAAVLGWTTIVIAIVFVGGFLALYRLGLSQIKLARQQQDFVSAVSHELKTPLTSIRMYGEMLKEGWADEDKRKQYYEYIHDESERLTRLISNVLQLAKITHNEPQFDLRPMQVGALLDQVRSKIANQVERAGFALEIKSEAGSETASVQIDDDCFSQIIINLVDNAIKFSKNAEVKRIEVSSHLAAGDKVEIRVRDHGPGIPKDQLKKIFRLFYRTESELTRETVGTGIGLAIVHQLTTAMNGSVDVVNKEPGTEFRISFPAGGDPARAGEIIR
jgi:signal transduction histidine kinase